MWRVVEGWQILGCQIWVIFVRPHKYLPSSSFIGSSFYVAVHSLTTYCFKFLLTMTLNLFVQFQGIWWPFRKCRHKVFFPLSYFEFILQNNKSTCYKYDAISHLCNSVYVVLLESSGELLPYLILDPHYIQVLQTIWIFTQMCNTILHMFQQCSCQHQYILWPLRTVNWKLYVDLIIGFVKLLDKMTEIGSFGHSF